MPDGCFLKGFVVIESPAELDITAVYTAGGHDGDVTTMDVETIEPRKARKPMRTPEEPPEDVPERPKLPDLVESRANERAFRRKFREGAFR